jgi:pimeloyl-ACP methyl ester carboxylesterase
MTSPAAVRTGALGRLKVPTVVAHGTADRMCHPCGGHATVEAIPDAKPELIEGMDHELPPGAWPRVIAAITRNPHSADHADQADQAGNPSSRGRSR